MATVYEVIERFGQAQSNFEAGPWFEELMVQYFRLDPLLPGQYTDVCRWLDWPHRERPSPR